MRECPVNSEAFETAPNPLYSSLLLAAGLGVAGQALVFNPCGFRCGLQLQPAWPWVRGLSGHELGGLCCSLEVPGEKAGCWLCIKLLGQFSCVAERQRCNMNHGLAQILRKPLQLY